MQLYRSAASFAIRWTMNAYLLTVARAGGALHMHRHSKETAACCNRPHGWKGVALRCRRSPRSELEVFCAQIELKVLASGSASIQMLGPADCCRRDQQEAARQAIARRLIGEDSCERIAASRALTWSTQSTPNLSSTARSARKAPPTRAHK